MNHKAKNQISQNIFGYDVKGTQEEVSEMYDLLNYESYDTKEFQKYFHIWVSQGTGVYWFPKEKYYGGNKPYVVALLHYGGQGAKEIVYASKYQL